MTDAEIVAAEALSGAHCGGRPTEQCRSTCGCLANARLVVETLRDAHLLGRFVGPLPCEHEHDYNMPVMTTYPLTYSCKHCGATFQKDTP